MISPSEVLDRPLDQAGALVDNGPGCVVEAAKIYRVLTLLVGRDNLCPTEKVSQRSGIVEKDGKWLEPDL